MHEVVRYNKYFFVNSQKGGLAMKINWQYFLQHVGELKGSEFSKTIMGKLRRRGEVVAVVVDGQDLSVYAKDIPAYTFYENNTWVFLLSDNRIHLKRYRGEAPLTIFEFRLRVPFPIPKRKHHTSPAG